jgi:hypothetical protein
MKNILMVLIIQGFGTCSVSYAGKMKSYIVSCSSTQSCTYKIVTDNNKVAGALCEVNDAGTVGDDYTIETKRGKVKCTFDKKKKEKRIKEIENKKIAEKKRRQNKIQQWKLVCANSKKGLEELICEERGF